MRCRTCDYALWDIRGRVCPECGSGFKPSDFDFPRSAVAFLCPGCGKAYYGTSPRGHLEPASFRCGGCGGATSMDEMVVTPRPGAERALGRRLSPWLRRGRGARGLLRALLATAWQAHVAPERLIRGTPPGAKASALRFVFLAGLLYAALAWAWPMGLIGLASIAAVFSGAAGPGVSAAAFGFALAAVLASALGLVAWSVWHGLAAHALLRLRGRTAHGLRRTMAIAMFAAGAAGLVCVPFLSPFTGPLALVWVGVSASVMLRVGQGVRWGRAALAGLGPVGLALLVYAGLFVLWLAQWWPNAVRASGTPWTLGGAPSAARSADERRAERLAWALREARQVWGEWPRHGARLMLLAGDDDLRAGCAAACAPEPAIAAGTLAALSGWDRAARESALWAEESATPAGVTAHRVGDVVFVYHGLDASAPAVDAWLLVVTPACRGEDEASGWTVATGDGRVERVPGWMRAAALAWQNDVRGRLGLAPIPDPEGVAQGFPAAAGETGPGGR